MSWMSSGAGLYYAAHGAVAVAYMPACLALFHHRRHRFPIQGWDQLAMLVMGSSACLVTIVAAFFEVGLMLAAASLAADTLLLQSAVLYAKAALSHDRIGLARVQSRSPESHAARMAAMSGDTPETLKPRPDPDPNFGALQSTLNQIWLLRHVLTPKAAVPILVVNLAVTGAAVLALAGRFPVLRDTLAYQCWTTPCQLLVAVVSGEVVALLALTGIFVWRIRLAADTYGVRAGLLQLLAVHGVVWALYAGLAQSAWRAAVDPALHALLIGQHVAFALAIVRPLARSYRPVYQSFQVTNGTMLDMFLVSPRHFKAFRDYLESEFSVENLLFWRAALEYHMACMRMITPWSRARLEPVASELHLHKSHPDYNVGDRLRQDAITIFQTYIEHGAPSQINISSEIYTQLAQVTVDIEEGGPGIILDPLLFENARLEIVQLMSHDSLVRFRETSRGRFLWDRFLVGSRPPSPNESKMSRSQSSVHVHL